jgi:transcriptional regulator with XRE-family HTH domain
MSAIRDLGEYIREQRKTAKISLRQLSALAGVSNPYLSQIERGLRKPSAEILQQIAKALRISAEALYVQAGILDERGGDGDVVASIMRDEGLNERQKQVLLEIYDSFAKENAGRAAARALAEMPPMGGLRRPVAKTTAPATDLPARKAARKAATGTTPGSPQPRRSARKTTSKATRATGSPVKAVPAAEPAPKPADPTS